ncbi:MAG: M48 family metallopeptidase [Gammaproteobacteria bacterium]|nr:M48 family metallopeptidase [Gammaproteobacteria bacterium]
MASDFIIDDNENTVIDYSLRVSSRARYAKLQIKPYSGLEVVVPRGFPKKVIPEFVKQHSVWIRRQLQKHGQQYAIPELPERIYLAINESITCTDCLNFGSNTYQDNLSKLRTWLRNRAWEILPPILESLSTGLGLNYQKISIRSQKTRWGSCSSSGTISLNDQLLFVPRQTAEYLMIHELCHTRHMNHSVRFWRMVGEFCPDYRDHELVLNRARRNIPDWFQYSLYR